MFEVLRSGRLVQGILLKWFSTGGFGFLDIKLVGVRSAKNSHIWKPESKTAGPKPDILFFSRINVCVFAVTLGIPENVYKARSDGAPLKSAPGWATHITSCS